MQNATDVVGQACTVTEGPNKGKKGKYTSEDGRIWCEGSWGATECNPGGKCKDAKSQVTIIDGLDRDGVLVYQANAVVRAESGDVFHVTATIDPATGGSRDVSAIPLDAMSLDDLRKSESEVERMLADAIGPQLSSRTQQAN